MDKQLALLVNDIRTLLSQARQLTYNHVNRLSVITNFEIGKIIVEHEQFGSKRAPYGKETLKIISGELSGEFGRGYSVDNLELMRSFYTVYRDNPGIIENLKSETLSRKLQPQQNTKKSETLSRIFQSTDINLFKLSWSHYVELI